MEKKYTPGNWSVGKLGGTVITDKVPEDYRAGSGHDDTDYYGGFLIGESMREADARLCSAVPELVDALQILIGDIERGPEKFTREQKIVIAREAIKKAIE